jgi:AraC family transcriptional regulator
MFLSDPSFAITPGRTHDAPRKHNLTARRPDGPAYGRADDRAGPGARIELAAKGPANEPRYQVSISPPHGIKRRITAGEGLAVEIVQSTRPVSIEHRFCAPLHLLIVHEEGAREAGETTLGDLPSSTLRSTAQKLTFVPAGQPYHEWRQARTPTRLIYVYFEPAMLAAFAADELAETALRPRLFFEDRTLLESALKLKRLVESPASEDRRYFEALGAVLIHELLRTGRGAWRSEPPVRGGLAAWQERLITSYIEEHLAEPIPLQTLAELARLSPHYFCRAFKQSFGFPPHRYHNVRRIERAKAMLAGSDHSVTEIGLRLGFSETSSFSTAFRKTTGLTPTAYHRSLG